MIFKGLDFDWRVSGIPKFKDNKLQFPIKGIFYDDGDEKDEPDSKPSTKMPMYDSNLTSKFQVFITN
jgi:hypothetical protein